MCEWVRKFSKHLFLVVVDGDDNNVNDDVVVVIVQSVAAAVSLAIIVVAVVASNDQILLVRIWMLLLICNQYETRSRSWKKHFCFLSVCVLGKIKLNSEHPLK